MFRTSNFCHHFLTFSFHLRCVENGAADERVCRLQNSIMIFAIFSSNYCFFIETNTYKYKNHGKNLKFKSKSCTYFYERKIIKIEDYELQQQKNYIELKPILLESYLTYRKKY